MAKIPGWVYIIVGVAISAVSKMVEAKTKPGQFKLFFWLGIAFVIIGVFKLVMRYVFGMGGEEKDKKVAHHRNQMRTNLRTQGTQGQSQFRQHHNDGNPHELQHMQGQHHVSEPDPRQGRQDSSIVSCPNCSTRHYSYADFCMKCGTKMKR
ncbi:MAG: hypothetical protein V1866_00855 [archaeon]